MNEMSTIKEGEEETKALIKRVKALVKTYDSQSEFGRAVGLSRSTVSAIVNNRIENLSFTVMKKIIEGTGCSEAWLISGDGHMYAMGSESTQAARASAQKVEEILANQIRGRTRPSAQEGSPSADRSREMLIAVRALINNFLAQN
ncbi:MAG TPA: helix-turn-helix transcriptional regulator [Fodinibius sp.]|nr:helix-turn-helix transcriptional regulator [Fodinibius sp.]